MSRRRKTMSEETSVPEEGPEEDQQPPVETRRTRSGRTIRAPAAALPSRTPSRRTRRSVLKEEPESVDTQLEEPGTEDQEETQTQTASSEPETQTASSEPETQAPSSEPNTQAPSSESETIVPSSEPETIVPSSEPETQAHKGEEKHHPSTVPPPEPTPARSEPIVKKKPRLALTSKQIVTIPLGKPKSGRVWKDRNKQRFSALLRDKPLCSSWEKKMEARREKQMVKQYSRQLKEEKAKQKEEKRKRREEHLKRREENQRKAEIVQVIRNTAKIKRMKKKQLRKIEKRDTLAVLQKSEVKKVKPPKKPSQE